MNTVIAFIAIFGFLGFISLISAILAEIFCHWKSELPGKLFLFFLLFSILFLAGMGIILDYDAKHTKQCKQQNGNYNCE